MGIKSRQYAYLLSLRQEKIEAGFSKVVINHALIVTKHFFHQNYILGVDDVASECDLDDWIKWNLEVKNNDDEELEEAIEKILNFTAFTLS